MRIKGNYHTHSRWCRHGFGELEEYIHRAIDVGFEELAFTEHVPHPTGFTWFSVEEFAEFDKKLNTAIMRYGDQIKLIKGFECEYFEDEVDFYKSLRDDYGYDFLILGQHSSGKNREIDQFKPKGEEGLITYTKELIAGMESGLFKYVAHPDLLLHKYKNDFDKLCERCLNDIYQCASENKLIVEINCGGIRNNRRYPSKEGFEISKKYKLQYMIGADAHDPRSLMGDSTKKAIDFANDLGITVLEKYNK